MTPWATNAECAEGAGVHLLNDEVWTELVDKDDPHVHLRDGDPGAVV